MSLRKRLLAAMALVAIMLVAVAAAITLTTRGHLVRQVDDRLLALDGYGRPPYQPGGQPHSDGNGSTPPPQRLSDVYEGVIAGGVLVDVGMPTGSDDRPALRPDELHLDANTVELLTVRSEHGATAYRVLLVGWDNGTIGVRATSLDDVDETVRRLVVLHAVGTAGVLALLALATWWVQRLGIRPVKQMTAAATRIAGGDLDAMIPAAADGTEAGELSTALNSMLTQIRGALDASEQSERRLRRFVADASHELRTPLTTIRGYAELYRHGGLAGEAVLGDAMRRTEQEAARMGRLVEDMLTLAKFDDGRPLRLSSVDLGAVVADVVGDINAATDRSISSKPPADGVPAAIVRGDDDLLRQAVLNVVNNAVVHTSATATIDVAVTHAGDRARIAVVDTGEGVDEALATKLTERFFRADTSRSRDRGGSGLGLSIVAEIVAAHGGTVEIYSSPGHGTSVVLELPIAGPPPASVSPR